MTITAPRHPATEIAVPWRYASPKNVGWEIYTDGSRMEVEPQQFRTGFGIVTKFKGITTAKSSSIASDYCSVFVAELMAIREAINIAAKKDGQITIFTDSLSSLHALADPTHENIIVNEIKQNWNKDIILNWIKAHVGHDGNEEADRAAKDAITLDHTEQTTWLTTNQIKSIINEYIMTRGKQEWTYSTKGRQTHKFFKYPKTSRLQANFYLNQFLTGHGVSGTHQSRFFRKSSISPYCDSQQDIIHLICHCPKFHAQRGTEFQDKTEHQLSSNFTCRRIIKEIIKNTLEDMLNPPDSTNNVT
ncbi:uncharacterized protein [Parasteatoda tepidariorum]|uniref:uncharacterized protein n=1 Tax=Parasteatoda tepidariorum TaxID=114398 RepID=UPI001C722415|nr:uncharacterized protein LOC107444214 [Parasteatoda tepidariorum]